jgi:hypothetical protein
MSKWLWIDNSSAIFRKKKGFRLTTIARFSEKKWLLIDNSSAILRKKMCFFLFSTQFLGQLQPPG